MSLDTSATSLTSAQASAATSFLPTPAQHLLLLAIDILIWSILAWYADKVIPDQYGYRRSLFFFLGVKNPMNMASNNQDVTYKSPNTDGNSNELKSERLKATAQENGKNLYTYLYLALLFSFVFFPHLLKFIENN